MLSGMDITELTQEIERVKARIAGLGPLRPGTIYQRLNVCGRPGCKCGRKDNPIKHGPYHYLSYTLHGKSHTEFIRQGTLEEVGEQVRSYQTLMALVDALVNANLERCKLRKKEV